MIVPIRPPLSGISAQRYLALARTLGQTSLEDEPQRRRLLRDEVHWCRTQPGLDQARRLTYVAVAHLLVDLHRMGWEIREAGYGIELVAQPVRLHGLTPDAVQAQKAQTRAMFRPAVAAQLGDPAVRQFVRRMEHPDAKSGKRPITLLIADGAELHARLRAFQTGRESPSNADAIPVRPYLQLASSHAIDPWTGHGLREIWRYFRYTWSIPQTTTPGRQLLYLVRDAAHPCHAVMGLIGLNNSALQMGALRERDLGWSRDALIESLHAAAATGDADRLRSEYAWMEARITDALADVATDGLVTDDEQTAPTPAVVARLRHAARDFDRSRDATLSRIKQPRVADGIAPIFAPHPPVADAMLNLEPKPAGDPIMQQARRYLVARKRATLLAELLQARLTLRDSRANLCDPSGYPAVVSREPVVIALQTVLDTLKSRYAGINLLEVSTCGAIAPYNHILGGKLAALLLFSPEIADDYRSLYNGPSIIASQIKNEEVRRDATLVYLATTSLYAAGSSQYERVRLPAGIIAPDQAALAFSRLGLSQGYGTLQFMTETRKAVEIFLRDQQTFSDVNSIFGEGPSPKLRKFTAAMARLGFPPDELMLHHRPRIIYGARLMPQVREVLTSRPASLPDYISNPGDYRDAGAKIAAYWRERWLLKRCAHAPSMTALMLDTAWCVGDRIPIADTREEADVEETGTSISKQPMVADGAERQSLWREVATAGPRTVSDNLSAAELERMHLDFSFEPFVVDHVRKGESIFLTGNAGDGKTHILRRLAETLQECGAIVIEDATAAMRKDQLSPILEKWRDAHNTGRPFCIAINEYPLYLLERQAQSILPDLVRELDRQGRQPLVYGAPENSEQHRHKLLLMDLNLRNPLSPVTALAMLNRLLEDLLDTSIAANTDPLHLSELNQLSLKNTVVQERLARIFERIVDVGARLTMRELWILLARMVFGYRADLPDAYGDQFMYRYSEVLFSHQPHIRQRAIFALADPASVSHPYWDAVLEERQNPSRVGWAMGEPLVDPNDRPERAEFRARKRLFYFEHEQGEACFELEDQDLAEFRRLLSDSLDDDLRVKRQLIDGLNRAFCPLRFAGSEDNLYLWNGHRFHDQPTRSFLADRFVPASKLQLLKPRLPTRVADAFPDYRPDHLLLEATFPSGRVRLRLDFLLFRTLQRLRRGLPRKLLPEDEAFRLDSFIEALSRIAVDQDRRILSVHMDKRELLEVELSADKVRYEGIRRHG